MKKLPEHGEYMAGRSQQTIMFAATGPWNDETLVPGSKEMGQNIKQLNLSEPWGFISRLFGETLMPPKAYKLFVKHTRIRKSMGMQCLAVVIQDSDIANTIISQLTQAYQQAGVDYAFFSGYRFRHCLLKRA
jgi:hypothetical protein